MPSKNEQKNMTKKGTVYIVGAGPGDPGLITVRGKSLLESADVIIYDRLISKELFCTIDKKKTLIAVKPESNSDSAQRVERIYEGVDEYISQGHNVVRLKGGDPFLFGRGWEEIELLKRRHIRFKVVPGVSSALGVPTSIGLPLTHRDFSSSVLIITGHRKRNENMDWKNVSRFQGTIVVLMGIGEIEKITRELMVNGMDGERPVAVIQSGTRLNEKIVAGRLSEITQLVQRENIIPPGIIIIGEVVKLWLLNRFIDASNIKWS